MPSLADAHNPEKGRKLPLVGLGNGPLHLDISETELEAKVNPDPARRRTAAQSMTTKRKAGTVAKSQSGKRSTKAKRKVGSVRRGKS